MIKLTFCLRRLPHLTRQEFQQYWREQHGPLVRELAGALGIHRYVQCHTLASPVNEALRRPRGGPDEFDGVAELWFESEEALQRAGAMPEGRAAGRRLLEDERRFIDFERSPIWISREHVVVEGR